jgi:hypothetical protein
MPRLLDDIAHYRIKAEVFNDRVVETHTVTNIALNKRQERTEKVWRQCAGELGKGGDATVHLQECDATDEKRAVKRIWTKGAAAEEYLKKIPQRTPDVD